MKKLLKNKTLFYGLIVIFILLVAAVLQISKTQIFNSQASTQPAFVGIQLYKGTLAKSSNQPLTLTGSIYTGTGSPDLAVGTSVVVGLSTVGKGEVTVSDSKGNSYNLIKRQAIDSGSAVYMFRTVLSNPLKAYDQITVQSTSAKSIAVSALAFNGAASVLESQGIAAFDKKPVSPAITANQGNLVINIYGFRAKSGDFSSSYEPIITAQSGADSGTSGSSLDNSSVILQGFISPADSKYSINLPISDVKNKSGLYWGSVGASFY